MGKGTGKAVHRKRDVRRGAILARQGLGGMLCIWARRIVGQSCLGQPRTQGVLHCVQLTSHRHGHVLKRHQLSTRQQTPPRDHSGSSFYYPGVLHKATGGPSRGWGTSATQCGTHLALLSYRGSLNGKRHRRCIHLHRAVFLVFACCGGNKRHRLTPAICAPAHTRGEAQGSA
jgi:hypothetical protein